MKPRVFIIHGWDGSPRRDWIPWLSRELTRRGFRVHALSMPNPAVPKIKPWINRVAKRVGRADEQTYFVGHSIATRTILKYLEGLPKTTKVGGCVFVAGWFTLKGLDADSKRIAKPWMQQKINFAKIKSHTRKFVAIFSDNDPFVPLSDRARFHKNLGAKIITEHKMGHYTDESHITRIPSALKKIIKMSARTNL